MLSVSSASYPDVVWGRHAPAAPSPVVKRREGKAPMGDEGHSRQSPKTPTAQAGVGAFVANARLAHPAPQPARQATSDDG
jgi:hypothetical protein